MQRRTITFHEEIFRQIQKVRATFIADGPHDDMSFTTAVNMLVLGGLLASERLSDDDWQIIAGFLKNEGETLDLDSFTDRRADGYLRNLPHFDDSQPEITGN